MHETEELRDVFPESRLLCAEVTNFPPFGRIFLKPISSDNKFDNGYMYVGQFKQLLHSLVTD